MLRSRFFRQTRQWRCRSLSDMAVLLMLVCMPLFLSAFQLSNEPADPPVLDPELSDRRLQRVFDSALSLLQRDDLVNALPLMQSILDHPRDAMYHEDENDRDRAVSLKGKVLETIERFSAAQKEQYNILYNASAEDILNNAQPSEELAALEQVVRRYYFTETGASAAHQLAKLYFDRGQTLSAALTFQRLLKEKRIAGEERTAAILQTAIALRLTGMNDECLRMLDQFRDAGAGLKAGGETLSLDVEGQEALKWLDRVASMSSSEAEIEGLADWTLFRGNSERNATSKGPAPLREQEWEFRTIPLSETDDPRQLELVESELRSLARRFESTNYLQLPAMNPLLVDNIAVFRSLGNLKAIDALSGEMLWETFSYDSDFILLMEEMNDFARQGEDRVNKLQKYLMQRTWRDLTSGTLASDGHLVFAVEEQGLLEENYSPMDRADDSYNKLMAYELHSGKAVWEIGSPTAERPGMRFLGPPLVQGNTLYCIVSIQEEVNLVALQSTETPDGRTVVNWLWEQPLPMPIASELEKQMPLWKLSGLSPSYANGVLICPIAHGTVVGFDLARGIFSWQFRYQTDLARSKQTSDKLKRIYNDYGINPEDESRWLDFAPIVTNGRVLLTPCDSADLHCVSLANGALQWSVPRQQDLYVACVHRRQIVLVGRKRVHARDLNTGRELWSVDVPMPSGRGYLAGSQYHLPLSTAAVAVIDLDQAERQSIIPSQYNRVPGNLVAANGVVISQTRDRIYRYQTEAELQELLQDSQNSDAKVLRGEIALLNGERDTAIESLLAAYEEEQGARRHQVLVAALLQGLREDFPRYQQHVPLMKQLTRGTRSAYTLQELLAEGLAESQQSVQAFREFLQLAQQPEFMLERRQTRIRSDVWIRGQLESLYAEASEEVRGDMDLLLEERKKSLLQQDDPTRLRTAARMFQQFPGMDSLMRQAIQTLDEYTDSLALEQLLILAEHSADPDLRREALARHYRLLMKLQRVEQAAHLRTELVDRYADEICLENETGAQLAAWGLENRQLREHLAAQTQSWPGRPINVVSATDGNVLPTHHRIPVQGDPGLFSQWSFALTADRPPRFFAFDELGRKRIDLSLPFVTQNATSILADRRLILNGHLAVLNCSDQFYALNLLQNAEDALLHGPHNLKEPLVGVRLNVSQNDILEERINATNGHPQKLIRDLFDQPLGRIAIVDAERIVFQKDSELLAVSWETGELLWSRQIGEFGQHLFGHRHLIGCLPLNGRTISLFSTLDGQPRGEIPLQGTPESVETAGEFLIVQERIETENETSAGDLRLSAYHPSHSEAVWSFPSPENLLWQIIEPDYIATLDTSAQEFRFLDIKLGQTLATHLIQTREIDEENQAALNGLPLIKAFYLNPTRNGFLLCIQEHSIEEESPRVNPGDEYHMPEVNGEVLRLDRQGQLLWRQRVELQAYDPGQPQGSPIVVFLSRHHPAVRRFITSPHETQIDLLSDETGESLYHKTETRHLSRLLSFVHPEQQMVKLVGPRTSFVVMFGESTPNQGSSQNDQP